MTHALQIHVLFDALEAQAKATQAAAAHWLGLVDPDGYRHASVDLRIHCPTHSCTTKTSGVLQDDPATSHQALTQAHQALEEAAAQMAHTTTALAALLQACPVAADLAQAVALDIRSPALWNRRQQMPPHGRITHGHALPAMVPLDMLRQACLAFASLPADAAAAAPSSTKKRWHVEKMDARGDSARHVWAHSPEEAFALVAALYDHTVLIPQSTLWITQKIDAQALRASMVAGWQSPPAAQDGPTPSTPKDALDPLCLLADGTQQSFAIVPTSRLAEGQARTGLFSCPIIASFSPEVDIAGTCVPIEPQGEVEFDATHFVLSACLDALAAPGGAGADDVLHYGDRLLEAHTAPAWAKDHGGPFSVTYDEDLLDALITAAREGEIQIL